MTLEIWRDLTYTTPFLESDRLKNPVEYAKLRFEQNIIAGIKECGYQRQTGRSFRTLLRALHAIELGSAVLILVENSRQMHQMYDRMVLWLEEACTEKARFKKPLQASTSMCNIMDRDERRAIATIAPFHLKVVTQLPTDYDLVLLDNAIIDELLTKQLCGNYAMGVCDTLNDIEQRQMTRKELSSDVAEISEGSVWNVGDLFQLPKSDTVGTLTSINRVGCIPISLTVLYEGELLELPWDTCDIFHRVSCLS